MNHLSHIHSHPTARNTWIKLITHPLHPRPSPLPPLHAPVPDKSRLDSLPRASLGASTLSRRDGTPPTCLDTRQDAHPLLTNAARMPRPASAAARMPRPTSAAARTPWPASGAARMRDRCRQDATARERAGARTRARRCLQGSAQPPP